MDELTQSETKHPTQKRQRLPANSRKGRFLLIALLAACLLALTGSYFLGRASVYRHYPQLKDVEKSDVILSDVARLIQLPKDEVPSIAVINNAEDVKKEPFFVAARNDDVLIAYPRAGMAILYRPSDHILVNVGPIVTQNTPAAGQNQPAATVRSMSDDKQPVSDDDTHASSSERD